MRPLISFVMGVAVGVLLIAAATGGWRDRSEEQRAALYRLNDALATEAAAVAKWRAAVDRYKEMLDTRAVLLGLNPPK